MRISEKAIVLQSIKHGEKKYILKLFTQHHGTLTVSVNTSQSKSSKFRNASVMALNFVEVEILVKQNKDIHLLTEMNVYKVHSNLHHQLSKLSLAQFLHELMLKTLKDQHGHEELFTFVEECFDFLNDSEEGYSNLHLFFMLELSKHLGFEPQNNFSIGCDFFDVREGRFSEIELVWPFGLGKEESKLFSKILTSDLNHEHLSKSQKHFLLDVFLTYFAFHVPGFGNLKSPDVLKEVFND